MKHLPVSNRIGDVICSRSVNNFGKDYLMKKTTLAVTLLTTLSAALILPAAYAEDTTTASAPAQNCKAGDPNCKSEPAAPTEGTKEAAPATTDASKSTESGS